MNFFEKIFPFLVLFLSLSACGALLGAFVASRLMEQPIDVWQQLGQTVGGFMLGALAGLITAGVLVALPRPEIWRVSIGAMLVAALLLLVFWLTRPGHDAERSLDDGGLGSRGGTVRVAIL